MQVLQSMSTKGKAVLGAVALGTLVVLVLLFQMATKPSYQTVQAGLTPATTGKVTAALTEAGIGFELQDGGTAVAVESAKADQARITLAEAGVGGSAEQPGFELLEKQKLGTSSFQQQVAYQRALEGQIAQTIGGISGVGSAQVRLTMPKDELFSAEEKPGSAAVLLGAADLDADAVKGVANLVASSVPSLDVKNVTITDGTGRMLWPSDEASGGGASKQAAESRFEAQTASQLDAMLARTLGPDKAQVSVQADLDVDQTTEERLEYADEGTPLTSVEETESLEGTGGAGAAAGVNANVPNYGQAGAAGGESNYRKSSTKTDWGVNKTVTRVKKAPGAVNRMSVSVMVDDKAVPAAQVAGLKTALQAAVGAQAGRDVVEVTRIPFAEVEEPKAPAAGPIPALPAGMSGIAKGVGIGLGSLLFLFFVTRHLRKREAETLADEPSWLTELRAGPRMPELGAGMPVGAMGAGDDQPTMVIPSMADFEDPRKVAIEDLVEREPERVAAQLRSWITED